MHHVSASPHFDPGRSDFPSPVLTLTYPLVAFPTRVKLKRRHTYTSPQAGLLPGRPIVRRLHIVRLLLRQSSAQSPFARIGCYFLRRHVLHHVSERYPAFIAHTDSCVNPKSSHRLRYNLGRQVFAGCCQSLLEVGSSQRYLRKSFSRCLDPYPGGPCGAYTRFYPQGFGLPPFLTRSAHDKVPHNNFCAGVVFEATAIRLCSGLRVCSPPRLFLPRYPLFRLNLMSANTGQP